jgi:hypothetical protein
MVAGDKQERRWKMKNVELANYLEKCLVVYQVDYRNKMFEIKGSDDVFEFCDAVIHNLEFVVEKYGQMVKVSLICGILIATISKMKKFEIPNSKILAALDVCPRYLKIIIEDTELAVLAVSFFVGETADIRLLVAANL